MKRHKYILWIAAIAVVLISGLYIIDKFIKKNVPEELVNNIKNNRIENLDVNGDTIEKLLYDYKDISGGVSKEEVEKSLKRAKENIDKKVSKEDAIKDTEFLFRLLKYNYAGYQMNGGDEAFEKAKKNIINDINSLNENINTVSDYEKIFVNDFKFINDGHFAIAGQQVSEHYTFFTTEKYKFSKDKKGYFTYIRLKKYYLGDSAGKKPDEILKMSIDKNGRIVYYPVSLEKSDKNSIYIILNLYNSNKLLKKAVPLSKIETDRLNSTLTYDKKSVKGVPVITIKKFWDSNEYQLNEFVSDASELKKYNMLVIDVRGNGGGTDKYPMKWFFNYTGSEEKNGETGCKLFTDNSFNAIRCSIEQGYGKDSAKAAIEELEEQKEEKGEKPGWSMIVGNEYKRINNNNTIIVLTDSKVASSGESFISYLRTLNNVIFIGSNTGGCITCGDVQYYNLPVSNIPVSFGYMLFSVPGAEENKGFLPDIWVNPEYSMDRVMKFIKNYNLNNIEK